MCNWFNSKERSYCYKLFMWGEYGAAEAEAVAEAGAGEGEGEGEGTGWEVAVALYELAAGAIDQYGYPLAQLLVASLYGIYKRFTIIGAVVFLVKYVMTGLYMLKMLKSFYQTSRERIKQKQMELEDIQLQIQIVNMKLSVREAEYSERSELLRRNAGKLRAVRARVRNLIAADKTLRRALETAASWTEEPEPAQTAPSTPEQDHDFRTTLLKELETWEHVPERPPENMECGEPTDKVPTPEDSVYSSLSDAESKQKCRVKIVKVTNVYKIAYLKHFIKHKKPRRATQKALLKKKIDSIKKLLESWQKCLNSVLNSKIILDTTPVDMASQEAMGDYSKPNLRECSDSDSDLKTSATDTYNDDFNNWASYPFRTYGYSYEDTPETAVAKDYYDSQDYHNDIKYSHVCECNDPRSPNVLCILPEETSSQIAIEEIKNSETEYESECRELVAL